MGFIFHGCLVLQALFLVLYWLVLVSLDGHFDLLQQCLDIGVGVVALLLFSMLLPC